jgi:hypothetical protein
LSRVIDEQGWRRVRGATDDPGLHPAMVKIGGIPFCERCAREQEAY